MPTLHTLAHRAVVALLTVGLLSAPGALGGFVDPPDTLGAQLTAMSGTGLMLAECQERMQTLESMLGKAGYGPGRSHLGEDGSMIARWYHPQGHTTVLAFAGMRASDNAFSATKMTGSVGWNEPTVTP